jgi:hypothetical protein
MQRLERHASLYGEIATKVKSGATSDAESVLSAHEREGERAPLLRRLSTIPQKLPGATPLPKQQLLVILFLQLSEPVTGQSIYPFMLEVSV